jgi:hypothetical protein
MAGWILFGAANPVLDRIAHVLFLFRLYIKHSSGDRCSAILKIGDALWICRKVWLLRVPEPPLLPLFFAQA